MHKSSKFLTVFIVIFEILSVRESKAQFLNRVFSKRPDLVALERKKYLAGIKKVWLPGGTFQMGSPDTESGRGSDETQHWVKVKPFVLADTRLTRKQWKLIMGRNPSMARTFHDWDECPNCPVTYVSWNDTQDLIERLSENEICTRLPTEAEQEYYMRLGYHGNKRIQTTMRPFGDDSELLKSYAWFHDSSKQKIQPVGTTAVKVNTYGIQDALGNTWEWSQDVYEENYPEASDPNHPLEDPQGPKAYPGAERVLRSCNWYDDAQNCRSAQRQRYWPDLPLGAAGIRLAFCQSWTDQQLKSLAQLLFPFPRIHRNH
jgi:formylglycine-generating enzyme required for sulfatase activity